MYSAGRVNGLRVSRGSPWENIAVSSILIQLPIEEEEKDTGWMDCDLTISLVLFHDGWVLRKLDIEMAECPVHCSVPAHSTPGAPSQICIHAARIDVTSPWSQWALRHSETIEDY